MLDRAAAAESFDLPADRIGDLIVLADGSTVLGRSHDVPLRRRARRRAALPRGARPRPGQRRAGRRRDLVAWLAEQHVAAKRDLVATDRGYQTKLTDVSARTLKAQGGPMSAGEIDAFRAHPDWCLALELREIGDRGKVPGAHVPGLADYRDDLVDVVANLLQTAR